MADNSQASTKRDVASINRELERAQPNQQPQPSLRLAKIYAAQIIRTQMNDRTAPK